MSNTLDTSATGEVVYLLHLTTPIRHAKHYIGYTSHDLQGRLAYHRARRGSKLLATVIERGGDFVVSRVWQGETRRFERHLKVACKNACVLCPVCNATALHYYAQGSANIRNKERK